MEPALIALLGTVAGAVAFKVGEHFLAKERRREQEFAGQMKQEIRVDTIQLRTQLTEIGRRRVELDAEIAGWRSKYFELVDAVARQDLQRAQQIIKEEP